MTPAELELVISQALAHVKPGACLCSNESFRKTMSFDFQDYDIAPTGLADAEVLISLLLRDKRRYQYDATETGGTFTCVSCRSILVEKYDEYSIAMSRSTVSWEGRKAVRGKYVVGFFGLAGSDFARIHDFDKVAFDDFLVGLGLHK